MFLQGRVATGDATTLPMDVLIERVCNGKVRQEVYATTIGSFSMQFGSMADSYLDASGERSSRDNPTNSASRTGISRRELAKCELRASASGFRPTDISLISLVDRSTFSGLVDVGAIMLQRTTKINGMTLDATPFKAPQGALRAYQKGLDAGKKANFAKAQKYFEQAVAIYPKYASGWFQLGYVLQMQKQNDAAREAYIRATTIDTKLLPPYLALASMAYEAENWPEALRFSGHILALDPMADVSGYILDLDPLNTAEAYFYNAIANYKLNKIEEAEKSALKAEHVDLRTNFPQLHLLLADLFARKNNYASAISEIQIYLQVAPHAQGEDQVRQELARLEKLNDSISGNEKPAEKN